MCLLYWNSAIACEINVGQDTGDRGPPIGVAVALSGDEADQE